MRHGLLDSKENNKFRLLFFYRINNTDCLKTREALYKQIKKYSGKVLLREVDFDHEKKCRICIMFTAYPLY